MLILKTRIYIVSVIIKYTRMRNISMKNTRAQEVTPPFLELNISPHLKKNYKTANVLM